MSNADFWLVAGPNGARKSTLAQSSALATMPVPKPLNLDDVALILLQAADYRGFIDVPAEIQKDCLIQAANLVYSQVEKALLNKHPIVVETVLSADKCLKLFEVVARGGGAYLIYIGK